MLTNLKCYLWPVNIYFAAQNIMQSWDFMELSFKGFEMQKMNISRDRAQLVNEKNNFVCLLIIFTPRVMELKMSKMPYLCIFCQ